MYNNPTNWTLTTVVENTWTELVGDVAIITGVIVTNPTEVDITVSARLTASQAILFPEVTIPSKGRVLLELRTLGIPTGDGIEVHASANGAHFIATGTKATI